MRVLLRVLIVAAVVIALIAVEMSSRSGVLWRLTTFTYQANARGGVLPLTLSPARADGRASPGAVVPMWLSPVSFGTPVDRLQHGYTPANILLHVVVPSLVIGLAGRRRSQRHILWWCHLCG